MSSKNFHVTKKWVSILKKHIVNAVLDVPIGYFDEESFDRSAERFGYGQFWLPYSQNIIPCDYSLREFLKNTVNRSNLDNKRAETRNFSSSH
jgi:hypothetical protein